MKLWINNVSHSEKIKVPVQWTFHRYEKSCLPLTTLGSVSQPLSCVKFVRLANNDRRVSQPVSCVKICTTLLLNTAKIKSTPALSLGHRDDPAWCISNVVGFIYGLLVKNFECLLLNLMKPETLSTCSFLFTLWPDDVVSINDDHWEICDVSDKDRLAHDKLTHDNGCEMGILQFVVKFRVNDKPAERKTTGCEMPPWSIKFVPSHLL